MGVRVAIAGSGFGLYGLLPAFSTVDGCEVVGICGKSSERLAEYCKKAEVKRYPDLEQMVEAEKPDAIAIAVIPRYQHRIAKYALSNGIAVFAEKPLTTSVADSAELCELARKTKLPNMVDFIFPEIPEWAAAKKAIENGSVGKVLNISVEWRFLSHDLKNRIKSWKTDAEEGGGALLFFSPHLFYYLEYFMGRIRKLQCVASASEKSLNHGETTVNMAVLFENGCIGNVCLDIAYMGRQKHSIEFNGEEGTLRLQNNSESFFDNFELTLADKQGTRVIQPDASPDPACDPMEDERVKFVRSIAGRFIKWCSTGVASKPDFQDGLRAQELIEMAKVSNSEFWGRSLK